jgi:Rieske Fe-S protein
MHVPAKFTRRALLQLAGRAFLGLGGLVRFLGYKPDPPAPQQFQIGSVSDYPINSTTVLPTVPALLIRSGDTFRAISLNCSHLGCKVEARSTQIECPCHGSKFNLDGEVLRGPAVSALKELRVEITADGLLILYRS